MPKATYSVNKDGSARYIHFSGTFALTRANIKSFFAVFPETILSRSATYWPRERGSSYNNWGVIDDELLPSDRNINLPFGIYLVTPVAVDDYYVYRKVYSLDYLLGKILS